MRSVAGACRCALIFLWRKSTIVYSEEGKSLQWAKLGKAGEQCVLFIADIRGGVCDKEWEDDCGLGSSGLKNIGSMMDEVRKRGVGTGCMFFQSAG